MTLKKKKLTAKNALPDDAAETQPAPARQNAPADPMEPFRRGRTRRGLTALALSAVGLAMVGWLLAFTLDRISEFKLDFRGWLPAVAQGVGVKAGRTNILVAGVGGRNNDAPWLTDSVMLMSIDPDKGSASFLSIPRDLYVVTKDFGGGKINELYAKGRARWGQERGAQALMDKVSEITGEPVDKYVVADFDGFAKLVDLLGGVDVDVPEALTDKQYPDGNWGYETFSIEAGRRNLDGATALKYVRSRHSTSDFDRSRRQQLVLDAIKSKLVSRDVLTSPSKLRGLLATLSAHVWTDLTLADMVGLGAAVAGAPDFKLAGASLNDACIQGAACAPGALLYSPPREIFGGLAALLPNESDGSDPARYGQIRKFAYVTFHLPEAMADARVIRVLNATKTSGLASRFATMLRRYGFNVPQDGGVASYTGAAMDKTVVRYRPELAGGKTLEALNLWVFSAQEPFGSGAAAPTASGSEIEILLGEDAAAFLE